MVKAKTHLYEQDTRSYYDQCQALKGCSDRSIYDKPFPKPSVEASFHGPTAYSVPGVPVALCSVQRPILSVYPFSMSPGKADFVSFCDTAANRFWIVLQHTIALGCFFTFTWTNFRVCCFISALLGWVGVSVAYHRLLTHRSFKTFKVVEYLFTILATLTDQGPPMVWVSNHRYHHMHADTPLDPHTPYEGMWQAYMGWLFQQDKWRAVLDRTNVDDMKADPFHRFISATFPVWMIGRFMLTYVLGGFSGLVWAYSLPFVVVQTMTLGLNTVCHLWGARPYDTGDLSTNNWFWAIFGAGEGWHHNHHAFKYSARMGLEWWEIDLGYYFICLLGWLGLAWDIKTPTEADKARKRKPAVVADSSREAILVDATGKLE